MNGIKDIINNFLENDTKHKTDLCDIYSKYGSDKGNYHNYSILYNKLFERFQDKKINFMEVGLGTNNLDVPSNMGINGKPGASLYAIHEKYPLWNIYGADIDKRILFNDEHKNIKTFFIDQTDSDAIKHALITDLDNIKCDIIIDDGLHEYDANINLLSHMWEKLNDGGLYIIEDICNQYLGHFIEFISNNPQLKCYLFNIPDSLCTYWDNTLLIIEK